MPRRERVREGRVPWKGGEREEGKEMTAGRGRKRREGRKRMVRKEVRNLRRACKCRTKRRGVSSLPSPMSGVSCWRREARGDGEEGEEGEEREWRREDTRPLGLEGEAVWAR
jgi:hypothetical protein